MKNQLTNDQKINLLFKDLLRWCDHPGNDSLDSMVFAARNGFKLHAVNLWISTGAATESVLEQTAGVEIDREKEKIEIDEIIESASIFICEDCNYHHYLDKGDTINRCQSCNSVNIDS